MISPGRLAYHVFYRPRGALQRIMQEGGLLEAWRTGRGRAAMVVAAGSLPSLPPGQGAPVELHLLTGRIFWFQTIFCLWSFARFSGRDVVPHVYDDGTLAPAMQAAIRRLWPHARFVELAQTRSRLDSLLPRDRFPFLRERWDVYPNIRKLTDIHLGSSGWKLVLDSDLLFFRRPDLLLSWCDAPDRPLHAVDAEESYGYPETTLRALCGHDLPRKLNVGLCGLRSEELDWQRVEHWTRRLIESHGTHYFLEQALVAMLASGRACAVAPASDYVTGPEPPEATECRAVMHHYVADTKRWYYRRNWRRVLAHGDRLASGA